MTSTMPDGDWFANVEARTVLLPGDTTFWGDLRARGRDPFGSVWDLAQPA